MNLVAGRNVRLLPQRRSVAMAGNGPLPSKDRRRRNAPSIPTTELPVAGRKGRAPAVPKGVVLGAAGKRWWSWAWSTPQAAAWDLGSHMALAQRAQLEDGLSAIVGVDLGPIPADADEADDWLKSVKDYIQILQRATVGHVTILREMRERDDRLGLSPKAAAQLRMTFVADKDPQPTGKPDEVTARRKEREGRLAAADG